MKISDYFNTKVRDANLYTNYRVLPGIDGLKNTQRKCLYVMQKSGETEDKISNKASIIARETEYLHGNASLESVLSGLNISYPGSGNNLPVLKGKGQFGSKFNPDAIGASRYVYTKKAPIFDYIYRKEDIQVYDDVYFEGTKIEPTVLLPVIIPLFNGLYSIGNGFASNILPRDPLKLVQYTKQYLTKSSTDSTLLLPHIKGYNGTITETEFVGTWKKLNNYTIEITEIKPYTSLETYLKHLDKLIENKIIKDYKDESINDRFKFIISVAGSFWDIYNNDDKIINLFALKENISENIVMFDENNKIVTYNNIVEYVNYFIEWRLSKYEVRKQKTLTKMKNDLLILNDKCNFITDIVTDKFVINNKSKAEIVAWCNKRGYNDPEKLLSIPLYNLTKEELERLNLKIKTLGDEINKLEATEAKALWLKDLTELENQIS